MARKNPFMITGCNFSLPGGLKLRVSGTAWFLSAVKDELRFYQTEVESFEPELMVELAPLRSAGQCSPLGGVKWEGRHLGARWQMESSSPAAASFCFRFFGNLPARYIVAKWIVEPAMRLLAESRGMIFTHAAALSDGEKAMLVAGPGGAGKTSWVLRWLQAGHPFMSDDFSLLQEGKVWPYLTPLRLGARHLLTSSLLHSLPAMDKTEIIARSLIRRASGGRLKFYKKILITHAVPMVRIGEPVPLAGVLWLVPGQGKRVAPEKLWPADIAGRLTEVDRQEMHGFGGGHNLAEFLPAMAPLGGLDFWGHHQEELEKMLRSLPCFSLPGEALLPAHALQSVSALLDWLSRQACARP